MKKFWFVAMLGLFVITMIFVGVFIAVKPEKTEDYEILKVMELKTLYENLGENEKLATKNVFEYNALKILKTKKDSEVDKIFNRTQRLLLCCDVEKLTASINKIELPIKRYFCDGDNYELVIKAKRAWLEFKKEYNLSEDFLKKFQVTNHNIQGGTSLYALYNYSLKQLDEFYEAERQSKELAKMLSEAESYKELLCVRNTYENFSIKAKRYFSSQIVVLETKEANLFETTRSEILSELYIISLKSLENLKAEELFEKQNFVQSELDVAIEEIKNLGYESLEFSINKLNLIKNNFKNVVFS